MKKTIISCLPAMRQFLILPLILLSIHAYPNEPVQKPANDSLEARIDLLMKNYAGSDRPGAAIGIIDNGRLIFEKGYGMADLKKRIPNGKSNKYKIASLSKQFTAAAIAMLIRNNQLSITDNVRKYLPEFPDYGKPITIDNLLYHTSGIRDYMVLMWLTGKSFEDDFSNRDALDIIYRQSALNFITGNRCVYSNSNYLLLAEIIKKITGKTLARYTEDHLFTPLKMTASGFDNGTKSVKAISLSYKRTGTQFSDYKNRNHTAGDGGMYTTIHDLVKWDKKFYDSPSINQFILKKGKLENGNPLSYGMGIMTGIYKDEQVQMHPGAFLGYRAEMLRFPGKKITIICLGNSEEINPEAITRQIADVYVFKESLTRAPSSVLMNAAMVKDSAILGKYEVTPNVLIDIRNENDQLTGQVSGQTKQILNAIDADQYSIGTTGDKVKFTKISADKVSELIVMQAQGNTIARKLETVSGAELEAYAGKYYCAEQQSTYSFYIKEATLWFVVGTNAPERADIYKKYDRLYFNYQNLESATIDFNRNDSGRIIGFNLGSGRVSGLKFERL